MANTFIEKLYRINRAFLMSSGKSTSVFVERRHCEAKTELIAAKGFHEEELGLNLDEQSKVLVEATVTLMW